MKFANQKEAVFSITCGIIEKFGQKYDAKTNWNQVLTKPMKADIVKSLAEQFTAGNIPLDRPQGDKLESYCVGLLNNWLRRDTRLNSGVQYVGKVGNADPAIRETRKLLASGKITDPKTIKQIEETLNKMVAEKATKHSVEIDVSKLPEELKKFVA
jgi:hypothetical protein